MSLSCAVLKPEPCTHPATLIVDLWVEPVDGEPSILRSLPAPLCADHAREHRALDERGRRSFAGTHGIDLGRHALRRSRDEPSHRH